MMQSSTASDEINISTSASLQIRSVFKSTHKRPPFSVRAEKRARGSGPFQAALLFYNKNF
jgi:hypothetical protein